MKNFFVYVWAGIMGMAAVCEAPASELPRLRAEFLSPPQSCTQVPFWFWNDEITEQGILRQIDWMEQHGVYGFLPHARMGLSKKVGYMTERWLELARFAVEEAARRGMMVYLYDEGMYPSGSAHGKVVEGRPDLASQGLRHEFSDHHGPASIQAAWPLQERETPAAAVLMQKTGDGLYRRDSAKTIPVAEEMKIEIPEGDWTLFLFIQTPSGGVIRGVHWDEEDNQPNAPLASDLFNPEVAERFIQFTHEKYYAVLKDYFGHTIHGMFTDEPSLLAKRSKRGLKPWTTDMLAKINHFVGYDFTSYLPLLWVKAEDGFEEIARLDYQYACDQLLNQNYYTPLSKWCADHGIALTGHPAGAGDVSPQIYFQEPGQDVVWRWVLPGPTSLEGEQSTLGKSATSVAAQLQRPVTINECLGAFGWRLTMSEMKWLTDWLFVRGTNRLFPHAFYYSVREQRIYERPPDLSWHNLWADHYRLFSDYTNRMSWLESDSREIAPAAILTIAGHTPWKAARTLFQRQIDFHYLDETLMNRVQIHEGKLQLGDGRYDVLILDGIHHLTADTAKMVWDYLENGVKILAFASKLELHPLRGARDETIFPRIQSHKNYRSVESEEELWRTLQDVITMSVRVKEFCPDLRVQHRVKSGLDFYLLTNEGEETIAPVVTFVDQHRIPEIWNAENGSMELASNAGHSDQGVEMLFELHPRQSRIAVFHSESKPLRGVAAPSPLKEIDAMPLPAEGWTLQIEDQTYSDQSLGSWTENEDLLSFSGTGHYTISFSVSKERWNPNKQLLLDLGRVESWAAVEVNSKPCGVRLWPPFLFDVSGAIHPGENQLNIQVTNTRANELTKEKLPSGLFGPVSIQIHPR